jgi:hypothetical protein
MAAEELFPEELPELGDAFGGGPSLPCHGTYRSRRNPSTRLEWTRTRTVGPCASCSWSCCLSTRCGARLARAGPVVKDDIAPYLRKDKSGPIRFFKQTKMRVGEETIVKKEQKHFIEIMLVFDILSAMARLKTSKRAKIDKSIMIVVDFGVSKTFTNSGGWQGYCWQADRVR